MRLRHWPWQHKFVAVSAEQVVSDYWGDGSKLTEGLGTRETLVLLKCDCGKVKTRRLSGHWDKDSLQKAFPTA